MRAGLNVSPPRESGLNIGSPFFHVTEQSCSFHFHQIEFNYFGLCDYVLYLGFFLFALINQKKRWRFGLFVIQRFVLSAGMRDVFCAPLFAGHV